jgi:Arc/MetJ-type ribon-helix-helix transcriptional regulator
MKSNTKSSITLPPNELRLVRTLKSRLKLRTNVDVVRRGLRLLAETTERRSLKEAYRKASLAARATTAEEIASLDSLVDEGLE